MVRDRFDDGAGQAPGRKQRRADLSVGHAEHLDLDERQRYQRALSWAKKEGFTYGIGGSVNEWRYRSGADGEAAVGFTLHVVDLESGKTVWTATGARSGWGRETASGTAQRLLRDMITQLAGK